MSDADLVSLAISDLSGLVRGKAVPRDALAGRGDWGIGWTPTNGFITCFGDIAPSPYGALGDLHLRPDPEAVVDIDRPEFGVTERFILCDVREIGGGPWALCARSRLRAALDRLRERHGLTLSAAFEHEFQYSGAVAHPGLGFTLEAFRRLGPLPGRVAALLAEAGLAVDSVLAEFGPAQVEVTVGPKPALRAADEAAILRELVRAVARGLGERASFAPILDPASVGNGVHVHFSLRDATGAPVNYDPAAPHGISRQAGAFLGGVLRRLPDAIALTAPAVASYYRLTPHRWSAAYANLGAQDRESALRICPIFGTEVDRARKYHFEFRGADACASPHLVLAALIEAGIDGLDGDMPPPEPTTGDLSAMGPEALAQLGVERLPETLAAALDRLDGSAWARGAFGDFFVDSYLSHKRSEIAAVAGLTAAEVCARYAEVY